MNGIFCDWWRGYSRNVSFLFTMEHEHFFKPYFSWFKTAHRVNDWPSKFSVHSLSSQLFSYLVGKNDPSCLQLQRSLHGQECNLAITWTHAHNWYTFCESHCFKKVSWDTYEANTCHIAEHPIIALKSIEIKMVVKAVKECIIRGI